MHVARLIAITWWFQLKQSTKAGIFVFTAIIEPFGRPCALIDNRQGK